ncbi:uncharacterized protein F4812DRAFT_462923 [Daldinia caldariorum]|uniref:uncharacterized protein n=1 Tax=Daldinia caldariorum TaxID=326644 RepID=UPI0020085F00|nr:uncharacterized protein F4812DRAFT_462923 [Daldinia caldariorum]KAI1464173.1 hypothetical protein F4812DRAFT_462923 [Daldinia caldariorum]
MADFKPGRYRLGSTDFVQTSGPPLLLKEDYIKQQKANRSAIKDLEEKLEKVLKLMELYPIDDENRIGMVGAQLERIARDCQKTRRFVEEAIPNLHKRKPHKSPDIILAPAQGGQVVIATVAVIPILILFMCFSPLLGGIFGSTWMDASY